MTRDRASSAGWSRLVVNSAGSLVGLCFCSPRVIHCFIFSRLFLAQHTHTAAPSYACDSWHCGATGGL